jgi:hypothetical protein
VERRSPACSAWEDPIPSPVEFEFSGQELGREVVGGYGVVRVYGLGHTCAHEGAVSSKDVFGEAAGVVAGGSVRGRWRDGVRWYAEMHGPAGGAEVLLYPPQLHLVWRVDKCLREGGGEGLQNGHGRWE